MQSYPIPRSPKLSRPIFVGSVALCISILTYSAYATYEDVTHPYVCTLSSSVNSILSVEGRNTTILLDNGETHSVNQATLKPGSDYCLAYKRL